MDDTSAMPGNRALWTVLVPWRWTASSGSLASRAILTVIWTANLILVVITIVGFFVSDVGYDWLIYVEAGERVGEGGLYDWEGQYTWSYSPLLAYVFAIIAPIGFVGWSALHVAALGLLRNRWLAVVALMSWPFWADVYNGNTMTFVFVAAVGALTGSSLASGVYLLLGLLMPRPLMLPLMVWILWKRPAWRLRFVVMGMVTAALVVATGQATAWIEVLLGVQEAVDASSRDIGPSRLLGAWWLAIGSILALVLTLRGRIGWASLAASPYWLPQYLIMLLLQPVPSRPSRDGS